MDDAAPPPDVTSLDRAEGSATAALYRAAVGSISSAYYERVFTRFDSEDRTGPSWNWAAACVTPGWMAFRRLWGALLVYLGSVVAAVLLVLGVGRLVLQLPSELEWALSALLCALAVAVPGWYGNALLYRACRQRMAEALAAHATVEEACAALLKTPASVQRMLAVASVHLAIAGMALAVYLLLPDADNRPLHSAGGDEARAAPPAALAVSAPALPASAAPAPETPASAPEPVAAAPAPAPPEPEAPVKPVHGKKFLVNVGLFADENNAHNVYTRLVDAGLPATLTHVKGARGRFTRVRVGPYATREQAQTAAEKVHRLKLDAVVVSP